MKIFFICQRVPFPPDRGDKIPTHHQIAHLARDHEVHVFCLADGKEDLDNVPGAQRVATTVTAFPFTPASTKLRALGALLTGDSLSVAAFSYEHLHQAIKAKFMELKPDIVIVYSCNVAQYAEHFPGVPRVMQFCDLDSLKWAQYAKRSRWPMNWVFGLEHRRLLAYERKIAADFDHSTVCTDVELRDFNQLIPDQPVSVLANGVDLDYFRSEGASKIPGRMIFTGVMDYPPNIDAVVWFTTEVLPLIRTKMQHASFVICGSKPVEQVQQLAKLSGVEVTGRVPDIRPYMDSAEVFVGPLRMARGVQNKVLEALSMGLPCVTTTLAWRGTVVPQGQGIATADNPDSFCDAVLKLLQEDLYRKTQGSLGRRAAEQYYAWKSQLESLDNALVQAHQRFAHRASRQDQIN